MKNTLEEAFVDTDVIIRLLTNDDVVKQKSASLLFQKVEKKKLILCAPDTVIADAVFVLSSIHLYHLPKAEIRDLLTSLIRLSYFHIENKQALLESLEIYATYNVDFGDAFLIASLREKHLQTVYSYDRDFDRISHLTRKEP